MDRSIGRATTVRVVRVAVVDVDNGEVEVVDPRPVSGSPTVTVYTPEMGGYMVQYPEVALRRVTGKPLVAPPAPPLVPTPLEPTPLVLLVVLLPLVTSTRKHDSLNSGCIGRANVSVTRAGTPLTTALGLMVVN